MEGSKTMMNREKPPEALGLEEDLVEAKRLFARSQRVEIKKVLKAFIYETTRRQMEVLTSKRDGEPSPPSLKKTTSEAVGYVAVPSTPARIEAEEEPKKYSVEWINVVDYGWSQSSDILDPWLEVTVGVRGADERNVTCDFGVDSFDLKVRQLRGKNYRFRRAHLDRDLEPAHCKFIVKPNKIVLKLRKRPAKNQLQGQPTRYARWDDLAKKGGEREKALDRAPKAPGSQYFDIVRRMYENGTDDMRASIGKTVEKNRARENQWGPDPLKDIIGDQDELFLEKCNELFAE